MELVVLCRPAPFPLYSCRIQHTEVNMQIFFLVFIILV